MQTFMDEAKEATSSALEESCPKASAHVTVNRFQWWEVFMRTAELAILLFVWTLAMLDVMGASLRRVSALHQACCQKYSMSMLCLSLAWRNTSQNGRNAN